MEPLTALCADAEPELPQSRLDADESRSDNDPADQPQSRAASGARWKPVRVRTNQVTVEGGYIGAPQLVDSLTLTDDSGDSETFFKISKKNTMVC